ADIDPDLWESCYHNPIQFLSKVDQRRMQKVAGEKTWLARYDAVMKAFNAYMHPKETWFTKNYPHAKDELVAYFSAEFGLHECLPIYSGGLGILSGDHCKAASDLGLPFIGVGLLYNQGYFRQRISTEGRQEAYYESLRFSQVPIQKARSADGEDVVIAAEMPDRTVFALVWKVNVGRVTVYLLDTDIDWNTPEDRAFSAQLYGGDLQMRISQEIVLGMGGVKALRALGLHPSVWHLNEGHSAFLSLSRLKELMVDHELSMEEAMECVSANAVFTTHTPVSAGHDVFSEEMMERYFYRFWHALDIPKERFLALGHAPQESAARFSMTILAMHTARGVNGVSKLHAVVSKGLWKDLWPGVPEEEIPIIAVTNGVHYDSWVQPELKAALDRVLEKGWHERPDDLAVWDGVRHIDDKELWNLRSVARNRMIDFVRRRVREQRKRRGESADRVRAADRVLDPNRLTIGFARRFATYKRATLIFTDLERFIRLATQEGREVQFIFAGKAHPADGGGQDLIRQLHRLAELPDLENRIVLLEDYDIVMGRHLVQGCDVWLNNPRRPQEASGTSGEKAALNGCLNVSILDGWWCEGFNGQNGWAVGEERNYPTLEEQDEADVRSLYNVLETEVIPTYYERDTDGLPRAWLSRVRESIRTISPQFSTWRMVKDYTNELYRPAFERRARLRHNHFALAKRLAEWKQRMQSRWREVYLDSTPIDVDDVAVGQSVPVEVRVWLGTVPPEDVAVELYVGLMQNGHLEDTQALGMRLKSRLGEGAYLYEGDFVPSIGGSFAFGVRARPHHEHLVHPHEVGLVRWANISE
ncbi:MAG TPA: alpha-glucan family phosphorylase, partial [Candidatus Xenobia bacterium]